MASLPVRVADRALPDRCSHTTLVADAVAAAAADCARVPELSQRPLASGAGPLAVLPGIALCTLPSELLQVVFHPPEDRENHREL